MFSRVLMTVSVIGAVGFNAIAEDVAVPISTEKCFPAKDLVKFYKKMSGLKPERTNTLEAVMSAAFKREDDTQALPKFWSRSEGVDTLFDVGADGQVNDFHQRLQLIPKTAELCGEILTKEGETSKIVMSIDNDVLFKNRTGPYSLAELQDGVADGKSFYKKMFGGPMALLVPKMTHVTVDYVDEAAPLKVSFTQAGQAVLAPPIEEFGGTFVISLEDIEASGADTMIVEGGAFKLMPTPSVKKMKSLGFSEEETEDEKGGD